jgi:AcrR family transcriptional regulator
MSRSEPDSPDSISAATRALADATASLTRMLGQQVHQVVPEVGEALATSLREAARGLADASDDVARRAGAGRAGATSADARRQQRVDRTRADLLDAAGRVIAAKGYEGASVGDIAAEAGYTKGALYAHFRSKSQVMMALARERLGLALDAPALDLPGFTADGVDVEELTAWLTQAQDDPRLLLQLEFLTFGLRNPDAGGELADLHVRAFAHAAAQVARVRRASRNSAGPAAPAPAGAGEEETPGQEDRDIALAIIGVLNVATLEGKLTGSPDMSPEAGARIIVRLLAD